MIEWCLPQLRGWIEDGCDIEIAKSIIKLDIALMGLTKIPTEIGQLVNLKYFRCANNEITKIPKEIGQLVNLKYLNCTSNQITEIPKEICQLVNLETFYCNHNKITKIPTEIGQLSNLRDFECTNNQIIEIPKEICKLIYLLEFDCSVNKIIKIPKEISHLANLYYFNCEHNKIIEIPKEIGQLTNLVNFYCSDNQITEIPKEIEQLRNLETLVISNNQITEIPIEIINCRNLNEFYYSNNTIEYIPPQVRRWFNRHKYVQKIYNDEQSVHNHNIQQCISNSINYITKFKPILNIESLKTHIINNNLLEELTKQLLFEYCEDVTVHSVLNITFAELLISVYDFILKHKHKDEIFSVLNKEITDSLCKCFTGRITRLINSLNGFDDNIVINISDAEQIGNIFIMVKQKLELEEKYSDDLFKEIVTKELQERNYDESTIKEWIGNM
ncbi:leucine rich repeat protein [Bodo saltans virus]|uniref:Leucine rich repeat protein n=1 Tax=Bodo saltans virus TaxID=2024608 RepID=A0A2H4UUY3_9VIRU|nr:leucine rich repeat protein [Bodo saltans virus]ATZ80669.1 leucine rich repeat protein [Bodo saltans virus]